MHTDILSHDNITLLIGIIAGVITAVSMMPQVFKTLKTKNADHVSPLMLIILILGVSCWVVYGFIKKDWPIIITNIFSALVSSYMLFLQRHYKNN